MEAWNTLKKAQIEWTEYIEAHNSGEGGYIQQTRQAPSTAIWTPPDRGVIKINADAAFSKGMDRTSLGAVARDWTGKILKAECKS